MYKAILKQIARSPFFNINIIICNIRTWYLSRLIDEGLGKIVITKPFLHVQIKKGKGAKLIIKGKLRIVSHLGGTTPVRILLAENSILKIDGDFVIGQGVRFALGSNAILSFGGKVHETDSGITSDTLIMVHKRVEIGNDFLCAWGVFITDSDWHQIVGQPQQSDVTIGNHVWIANNSSILKGTIIGDNCVIASHSKVINKTFNSDSLIAGIPAKVVRTNVQWNRDIINN